MAANHPYSWIQKASVIHEEKGSRELKTYTVHIKVENPCPSPRKATPRMIDNEFVWERLIQTKGRGEAVEQASEWFRDVKKRAFSKSLKNKATHECVTVDDKSEEAKFGSDFKPNKSMNRLLDKETITRLLVESKGYLKVCDKPYEKNKCNPHPSVDWVDEKNKVNKNPIKVGLLAFAKTDQGMSEVIKKANKKASALKSKGKDLLQEMTIDENRKVVRRMKARGDIGDNRPYWRPNKALLSKLNLQE